MTLPGNDLMRRLRCPLADERVERLDLGFRVVVIRLPSSRDVSLASTAESHEVIARIRRTSAIR
jgi:hypothetical protein